jgi:hypothetical protein
MLCPPKRLQREVIIFPSFTTFIAVFYSASRRLFFAGFDEGSGSH